MAHPMLETMLQAQQSALAICNSATSVEYESDPNQAGRTAIRITGPTKEAVQKQIDIIHRKVDGENGWARFVGPARTDDGYGALGEVVTFEPVPE